MSDDKSDKAGGWFANPLPIVMVVLLAAGVLVKTEPLKSARPNDPDRAKFVSTSQQDVEARLWQDPFAAVEGHERRSNQAVTLPENILMMLFAPNGFKTSPTQHTAVALSKEIQESNKTPLGVTVVAVSVLGGSYAEMSETRRRARFAVVSAIGFHDYHPENADALGYFHIDLSESEPNAGKLTVPYEWFKRRDKSSNVLVLWLNEDKFTTTPFKKLETLIEKLTPVQSGKGGTKFKLIGPSRSTILATLIPDLSKAKPATGEKHAPLVLSHGATLEVFAPGATISDCDLINPNSAQPWDCFKKSRDSEKLPIVRTTSTDDVLSAALLWELSQRDINRELGYVDSWWERKWATFMTFIKGQDNASFRRKCEDGLVLISERDTEYGRTLSRYLTEGFWEHCGAKPDGIDDKVRIDKPPVRTFSYLRGLDGILPDTDKSAGKAPPKDSSGESKDLYAQIDDVHPEHAEGRNQFDYLRRLGDEIDRLDDDKNFFAKNGVKAIGIVGSDLYDKLLILQALRNRFKDTIFFTTDLDARYLHADQKDWARNLVIASNFGLSLRPALQYSTLPFRDSYQTATYLATLMALSDKPFSHWPSKMKDWLGPQIFEIGRTEAVHLASPSIERLKNWREENYAEDSVPPMADPECSVDWKKCKSIEPGRPPRGLLPNQLLGILIIFIFSIPLVALTSGSHIRKVVCTVYRLARGKKFRLKLTAALMLILPVPVLISGVWFIDTLCLPIGTGEPFVWLEGVSVWPSLVLRFVCLVTMLALACAFYFWIRHQAKQISKDFSLGRSGTRTHVRNWLSAVWTGPFLPLARFNRESKAGPKPAGAAVELEIAILWQDYLRATHWRKMTGWTLACALLVFFGGSAAFSFFGFPSFFHRGQLVKTLHIILVSFNVLVLWLVIFWVGYETRACARLIKTLSDVRSVWPKMLLDSEEARTGVPRAHLNDYLDFQLIVRVTQRIRWLIFLPFISILFMVIARSNIFDAMDFPMTLVFVTGLAIAYSLHSALLLRWSAESARGKAIEHYERRLLMQTRAKDSLPSGIIDDATVDQSRSPISVEQIKILMERIHNNREGTFAPFAQQPALQAVLLPFGGYGSVQIIEYLFKL